MTPKLMPLPPCTATPAGLSSTSSLSSSLMIGACNDVLRARGHTLGLSRLRLRFDADRRHAHCVALLQPLLRPGALAVHAHLAFAHDAEDAGARNTGQQPHQELVQARAAASESTSRWHTAVPDWARFGPLWLGHLNLFVRYCFYSGLASILARPPVGSGESMVGSRKFWLFIE